MKNIVSYVLGFLLPAVLLASCAPSTRFGSGTQPVGEEATVTKVTDTVVRIVDSEYDVVCYFYADFEGGGALSCLSLAEVP